MMIPGGRKPALLLVCFTSVLVTYWYVSDPFNPEVVYTGADALSGASREMAGEGGDGKTGCKFPDFDPFNPEAMKFYKRHPTVRCPKGHPTITFYNGVEVKVNQTRKLEKLGSKKVDCWYRTVGYHRRADFVNGPWQGPFQDSMPVSMRPEFVEVKCLDERGKEVSRMHHYVTREEERKTETPPKHVTSFRQNQMNVLLLGLDSLSSHLFKRAMPKTRNFLLEKMNATEMRKYNKIGDNTFPNLLAISAGVYQRDLTNWTQMEGFDKVPFLFHDYRAAGYRTQYLSDRVDFDDFNDPPLDSYNVPMVRALMKDKVAFDNTCFEDKVEVKLWLDLFLEFARDSIFTTGRFFTVAMIKRPTHDFPNQASSVDEHYFNFLTEMQKTGLLNNTFMAFFGDHGPRTNAYRRTYHGSIEERAANMVLYVPPWFREQHPDYFQNLQYNADMLTTNFDIYETVRSLLTLPRLTSTTEKHRKVYKSSTGADRAINLFTKISPQRTCADASITPHMCLCNGAVLLNRKFESVKQEIAKQVVKDINSILAPKSSLCVTLKLHEITSVAFLSGQYGSSGLYRVMLTTQPGGAMFEATVQYSIKFFFFSSAQTLGLISRINMYRGQSDCVQEDKLSRMYCYCKDVLHKQQQIGLGTTIKTIR